MSKRRGAGMPEDRQIRQNLMKPSAETARRFDTSQCGLCPLHRIRPGILVRIKKLCGSPEISQRLREMGLYEDQVIQPLSSPPNVICQVCNTRFALGAALAQLILVEPLRAIRP